MKLIKLFVACYVLLTCCQTSFAANKTTRKDNSVIFKSYQFSDELTTCGGWFSYSKDSEVREVFNFWIRGFVSGNNFAQGKQVNSLPDTDSLFLYIDEYCRKNPLSVWTGAIPKLIFEIGD